MLSFQSRVIHYALFKTVYADLHLTQGTHVRSYGKSRLLEASNRIAVITGRLYISNVGLSPLSYVVIYSLTNRVEATWRKRSWKASQVERCLEPRFHNLIIRRYLDEMPRSQKITITRRP